MKPRSRSDVFPCGTERKSSEGMRVIIIDISKRKAAERALRWREEQSNQILNAMVDLICYCDGGMHVLWGERYLPENCGQAPS